MEREHDEYEEKTVYELAEEHLQEEANRFMRNYGN